MLYFLQVITIVAMALIHTKCDARRGVHSNGFQNVNYCEDIPLGTTTELTKICQEANKQTGECKKLSVEFLNMIGNRQDRHILNCWDDTSTHCITRDGSWSFVTDNSDGSQYCKLWVEDDDEDFLKSHYTTPEKKASSSQNVDAPAL